MPTHTLILPELVTHLTSWYRATYDRIYLLPPGRLLLDYIRLLYKDDPLRLLFELLLALLAIRYFLLAQKRQNPPLPTLSEKEILDLCAEWTPAPLVAPVTAAEKWLAEDIAVATGAVGPHVTHNGVSRVNLSLTDFLNISRDPTVLDNVEDTIRLCGVGACGPPNFYGTQDVHVRLCENLATFLGAESTLIYAQDLVTNLSVLPCFVKRGDLVVADTGVALSMQKALIVLRCRVVWFNHNDMDHLEQVLEELAPELEDEQPLRRRFIMLEGLFANFGDSPDLPRLVALKNKYKYRLYLDELWLIGVLGPTGRGLPEATGIPRSEIEITTGSMTLAFGLSGGFCVGEKDMVEHQRILSNAYVFSAALPPYCARAVSTVLDLVTDGDLEGASSLALISLLAAKVRLFYDGVCTPELLSHMVLKLAPESPVVHLRFTPEYRALLGLPAVYGGPRLLTATALARGHQEEYVYDEEYNRECLLLREVTHRCRDRGVVVTRSKRVLHHESVPIVPELLVYVNTGVSDDELVQAAAVVVAAVGEVVAAVRDAAGLKALA